MKQISQIENSNKFYFVWKPENVRCLNLKKNYVNFIYMLLN